MLALTTHSLAAIRHLMRPAVLFLSACMSLANIAHASTYVVVLKYPFATPFPVHDHAQITNPDGVFGIPAAGFGGYVDKGFVTVPKVSDTQLRADFGPALDAMAEIVNAGLPPLPHPYVVLLDNAPENTGSLRVSARSKVSDLVAPGQAMLLDGYADAPILLSDAQIKSDFGPLLNVLAETHKSTLPARSYVVLMKNPDGTTGKILVTDENGTTMIEQSGQAKRLEPDTKGLFMVEDAQIQSDFGAAIEAKPPLPSHVTLFFEIGSTRLTARSQADLTKLLAEIRHRPVPEIRVEGHADTVGSDVVNDKLSQQRAAFVAAKVRQAPIGAEWIEVISLGKRQPMVATPDNTPEPRNRRVEVYVR